MTRYLLIIILLLPQITQAIYRVYSGNMGGKKVEFYINAISDDNFNIIYIDDKTYKIEYLGLPQKVDNEYIFKNYTYDAFDNKDTLIIKNFDFSENQANSKDNFLIGFSNKFGDFKLEKKFEYNVVWNNGYKENHKDSRQLFNNTEFKNVEFLQERSTEKFYFKLLISKKKKADAEISGINIYNKKDGTLFQTIKSTKNYIFYNSFAIEIGDFDFDGNKNDFSLIEGDTRGPNVPHKYYIYDESQNKFIDPNLDGYVFDFDVEKKIATSTKTCGDVVNYTYNVLLNKLYYFNQDTKKYNYIDQYCMAIPDGENYYLRKCTTKEKKDCEKAVVEPGDEP